MRSTKSIPALLLLFTLLLAGSCTNNRVQQEKKQTQILERELYQTSPVEYNKDLKEKSYMRSPQALMGDGSPAKMSAPTGTISDGRTMNIPADFEEDDFNTEAYNYLQENDFTNVTESPLSTFSIDVDRASYSNVRRFINSGQLPPADAVRIEELVNYFTYDYPQPNGSEPFSINIEIGECPWNSGNYLALVGLQGKKIEMANLPPNRLTFLVDVSGSMNYGNKLPLLKQAFSLLVEQLRPQDQVAIVVYAGAAGVVLEPTPGNQKEQILAALDKLSAGGSTAGGEGILLAYKIAQQQYKADANNRVILASDGDFNVGVSSDGELTRIIEEKRKLGVYLTVLGFGMGNYKDSKMEILADKGNGNYAYIDDIAEARKVLVTELGATLLTIAKDVMIR